MTKLKTLKDCYMSDGRNYEQRLKEEAIKWIKTIEKIMKENNWYDSDSAIAHSLYRGNFKLIKEGEDYCQWAEDSDLDGAINVLKDFFNITEEDLTLHKQSINKGDDKNG